MQTLSGFPKQTFIIMLTALQRNYSLADLGWWLSFKIWVGWAWIQAAGGVRPASQVFVLHPG